MTQAQKAVQEWRKEKRVSAFIVAEKFGVSMTEFWQEDNASHIVS